MNRVWGLAIASAGLLLVGIVYGCIWYAIPNRPAARQWPIYGPLLFGPYALCSLACWLSPSRIVRALAVLTSLAGVLIAGMAIYDAWPTLNGDPPPNMPASVFAVGILIPCQYLTGLIATISAGALGGRSTNRY